MQITRTVQSGVVELAIEGRLDGYWADHLDAAIAEIVREGHDRLQLDLTRTSFLSSAGIAVLVRHHKQLARLNGSLLVSKASEAVALVLEMSRLTAILCDPAAASAPAAAPASESRVIERAGARLEVVDLDPSASLMCRVLGSAARLAAPGTEQGRDIACHPAMFMVGIGAIGTFDDCRERFGDLLAAGGAVVYQPADGTNVPDYLVGERAEGGRPASASSSPHARMLYAMSCEGGFASLARFEPAGGARAIDLPGLAEACLELSGGESAGVVIVAEVAGLVGAALRQSPFMLAAAAAERDGGFFEHPRVRERLTFTAERAFARNVALIAGVVARPGAPGDHSQLRPIGGSAGLVGHFHAAAFPYLPLRKGRIDLHDTVAGLFDTERVLGVLHLLHDDRAANGAGANEFIRGACWSAPIATWKTD